MIKDEGLNKVNPSTFQNITSIKAFLSMLCVLLLIMIWCSFENNIFTGLSLLSVRKDSDYDDAHTIVLVGLIFFSIFLCIDFVIVLTGLTFNFNKLNIMNVMLKSLEVFLMMYYYIDAWHYVIIWYIFIVTELPCTIFEVYGIIFGMIFEFRKYDKIRANEIKHLEKDKRY